MTILAGSIVLLPTTAVAEECSRSYSRILVPKRVYGTERRFALVIGNSDYSREPLPAARYDAEDMAQALSGLGFVVHLHINITAVGFEVAKEEFDKELEPHRGEAVALFYYAGHGASDGEMNKIVAFDDATACDGVKGADLNQFFSSLDRNSKIAIIILDACRTPETDSQDLVKDVRILGMQPINSSKPDRLMLAKPSVDTLTGNTFMAFASKPGRAAYEPRENRQLIRPHGIFTRNILKFIDIPGLRIVEVFERVNKHVNAELETYNIGKSGRGSTFTNNTDGPFYLSRRLPN